MLAIINRRILAATVVVIFIILLLSYYLFVSGALLKADNFILDQFFNLRESVNTGKDIVIVALDTASAKEMGRKSAEWKRTDYAEAIQNLTEAGADIIAIDVLFALPSSNDPTQDETLRKAMENSANVILVSENSEQNGRVPLEIFRQQEIGEGFLNLFPDEDGLVRTAPPPSARTTTSGDLLIDFPFSLQIALARLYPEGNFDVNLKDPRWMKLGNLRIPYPQRRGTDGFYINYAGPAGHFPRIPFYKILKKEFSAEQVQGRIVLIGNMNPFAQDYYPVPIKPKRKQMKSMKNVQTIEMHQMQSMYGVEIHANAIHTILNNRFIVPYPKWIVALLLAIFSILAAGVMLGWGKNAFLATGFCLLLAAVFVIIQYFEFLSGIYIPGSAIMLSVVAIAAVGLGARQAEEAAEKRRIEQLFGKYVAPSVVQQLVRNRNLVQFNGKKERLTIFFSDIRGFTTMSEQMEPEEVSELLNEYFSRMTKLVFKYGGTLDKFMGDCIMAFFGNPIPYPDHAKRAVTMAIEMMQELETLKKEWSARGKPHSLDVGIGICTGDVIVGNLGSTEFFDYTVVGDTVNLASRLQSNAKRSQILISTSTYEEVKDFIKAEPMEPLIVKGKSQPVELFVVKHAAERSETGS
jgi:adenylate cyclase